jgi:hypothetical protein
MGEAEVRIGRGFVGAAGIELLRMLANAKVLTLSQRDHGNIRAYYNTADPWCLNAIWEAHPEIVRTNVFQLHPPGNRLENFCGPREQGIPTYSALFASRYVRAEFSPQLDRLGDEAINLNPNLIVCLGNTAVWAFTGKPGVAKYRGTTILSTHCVSGFKLLVAYHPAAVLRQWDLRSTTVADLSKAVREREYAEIRRPKCEIIIEPEIKDVEEFTALHCTTGATIAVDIETYGSQITCLGIAPRKDLAIVIPFHDTRRPGGNYWPTPDDERRCWGIVRRVLEDASIRKVFQNGLYDISFIYRSTGIRTFGAAHDTMLLSHALQPELLKGLGFLGSLYTDHGPWKAEHRRTQTIKRDA